MSVKVFNCNGLCNDLWLFLSQESALNAHLYREICAAYSLRVCWVCTTLVLKVCLKMLFLHALNLYTVCV